MFQNYKFLKNNRYDYPDLKTCNIYLSEYGHNFYIFNFHMLIRKKSEFTQALKEKLL